jgi:hypothetical protein
MFNKYKYTEKEKDQILRSITILIDKREKSCDHITKYFDDKKISYKSKALSQGDYSFYIKANEILSIPRDLYFDKEVAIERKGSLEELSGNLSKERDRFEKELSLFPGKMFLLIENANYHDIYENNYQTQYNKKSFIGSLHTFNYRYNLPFIFIPKKEISGVYIYCCFHYYLKSILY